MAGWKKAGVRAFRSWWVLSGVGMAVLACLLGWPQWAITYLVVKQYTTGSPVLENVSWIDPLRIERGRVEVDNTSIAFHHLKLGYDLFPTSGRYLSELSADGIQLTIPPMPHEEGPFQGSSALGTGFNYLPVHNRFEVECIRFITAGPAGSTDPAEALTVGPLTVEADLESYREWKSTIFSDRLKVTYPKGDQTEIFPEGHVAVEVAREQNAEGQTEIRLRRCDLLVPEWAAITGSGSMSWEGGSEIAIDLPVCTVGAMDFSQWIPLSFPVKAKMESLDASGSTFFFRRNRESSKVFPTKAAIQIKGLQLFNAETVYYKGDFLLSMEGIEKDGGSLLQTTLMFDKGKQVNASIALGSNEIKSHLLITGLNGDDLAILSANKKAVRFPNQDRIADVTLSSDVCLDKQAFNGSFDAQFTLQENENTGFPARVMGKWHVDNSNLYNAREYEINAQIDSDFATAGIEYLPNKRFLLDVRHVNPQRVWALYQNSEWRDKISFDMKGALTIDQESKRVINNEHYAKWKADFSTTSIQYKGQPLFTGSNGVIKGDGLVSDIKHNRIENGSISGSLDTVGNVNLTNLSLSLNPFAGNGTLDGEVNMASFARVWGMDALSGRVRWHSGITTSQGILQGKLDGMVDGLGWKEHAFPYPLEVKTQGPLVYNMVDGSVKTDRIALTGNDGLALTMVRPMYHPALDRFTSQLTGQGDLQALASIGCVETASGNVQLAGNLLFEDHYASGSLQMEMKADMVQLKDPSFRLETATLRATIQRNRAIGFEGSGVLSIANIHFGGIRVKDLKGVLRFEKDEAILADESCDLWGGKITGETRIHLLAESLPVMFSAHASDLDLGVLLGEMQMDAFKAEGKIGGELSGTISSSGMHSMTLALNAPKGILLDQTLVTQLLSARMGNTRIVNKMVKKALGSDAMIPFEKATLNLHYEKDRYVGTIHLDGAKLAMAIDVFIEPRVFYGLFGREQSGSPQ